MSREITAEEAREMFISHCRGIMQYWLNSSSAKTEKEKMEGFAFSLMNIFDGTSGGFPAAIDLVLRTHPDDKQYCIENDENWIVDGQVINSDCHLHNIIIDDDRGEK